MDSSKRKSWVQETQYLQWVNHLKTNLQTQMSIVKWVIRDYFSGKKLDLKFKKEVKTKIVVYLKEVWEVATRELAPMILRK